MYRDGDMNEHEERKSRAKGKQLKSNPDIEMGQF